MEYDELKSIKLFLFDFFKSVNEYRSVGRYPALFLILVSFSQLYFLVDYFLIGGNLKDVPKNYEIYHNLTIFDIDKVVLKFTNIIQIMEYDKETFDGLYPLMMIVIYAATFSLIVSIIYVGKCKYSQTEIFFFFAFRVY